MLFFVVGVAVVIDQSLSWLHRRNVLKLQVFFEELDVEFISEQRSYEVSSAEM